MTSTPSPPVRRRLGLVLGTLLLLGAAAGGYYLWRGRVPQPPEVALAGMDPDVAGAVAAAREEVLARPRSADAWGRLGMVLFANDLLSEGLICLKEAERLDSADARWPYYQGLILLLRDPPAGLALLERAVEREPADAALRLRLAEALLAQDRLEEAEARFGEVLDRAPDNPLAHLGLGQLASRRERWQEGLDHLRRATASPFSRKAAHIALAEAYARLNDAESAEAQRRLAADLPDDLRWPDPRLEELDELRVGVQARIDRADRLLGLERPAEAITLLQGVLRDRPDEDEAHLKLAQAQIRLGQHAAAEQALREVLRLRPNSPDAHFLLGMVLLLRQQPGEAETHLRRTIELRPGHALAHYNLGQCLRRQQRKAEAREAFRSALRYRPNLAEAHVALAELLLEQGEEAEARQRLNDALRLVPDHPAAKSLLEKIPPKKEEGREHPRWGEGIHA